MRFRYIEKTVVDNCERKETFESHKGNEDQFMGTNSLYSERGDGIGWLLGISI